MGYGIEGRSDGYAGAIISLFWIQFAARCLVFRRTKSSKRRFCSGKSVAYDCPKARRLLAFGWGVVAFAFRSCPAEPPTNPTTAKLSAMI
jgi:hypothetical protein